MANTFAYVDLYVQAQVQERARAIKLLLAIQQETKMTHRERNHFNTVIEALTNQILDAVKPPSNGDIPF